MNDAIKSVIFPVTLTKIEVDLFHMTIMHMYAKFA